MKRSVVSPKLGVWSATGASLGVAGLAFASQPDLFRALALGIGALLVFNLLVWAAWRAWELPENRDSTDTEPPETDETSNEGDEDATDPHAAESADDLLPLTSS